MIDCIFAGDVARAVGTAWPPAGDAEGRYQRACALPIRARIDSAVLVAAD
jgi:hypothetical protein